MHALGVDFWRREYTSSGHYLTVLIFAEIYYFSPVNTLPVNYLLWIDSIHIARRPWLIDCTRIDQM